MIREYGRTLRLSVNAFKNADTRQIKLEILKELLYTLPEHVLDKLVVFEISDPHDPAITTWTSEAWSLLERDEVRISAKIRVWEEDTPTL